MERDLFLAALFKGQIKNLESKIDFPRYGVSGVGGSTATLTRLWDAVGKTAQVGTDGDNSGVVNDFDTLPPFNRRKCVGSWKVVGGKAAFVPQAYHGDPDYTEDGSKGDYVCVDVRPFYYYEEGDVIGVSAGQHEGWKLHEVCKDRVTGLAREHTYLPCYALAKKNGKAVSLPGLRNECGAYKALWDDARTYDGDAAEFAILEPSAVDHYEWLLQTIEFATQNSNNIMYGALNMRFSNDDTYTPLSETSAVVNATFGNAAVVGQNICVKTAASSIYDPKKATHKVTALEKCDEDGTPNASGTFYLLTVEAYEDTEALTVGTSHHVIAAPWNTGACASISTPSGSTVSNTDGKHPCRYRWRENPWGNQLMTCVDLMNKRIGNETDGYSLEWYFLPDPLSYYPSSNSKPDATDLTGEAWVKLNVTQETYADGYIQVRAADPLCPHVKIPVKTTGASSSTYTCDYAYLVSSNAVRAVRRRGNLNNGANGGACYVNGNNAPANANTNFGGGLFLTSRRSPEAKCVG